MRFSIIVPAYNAANTLIRCVDSILTQTFQDYEAILVNDGSTDNTKEIIDEYARKDARIIALHKSNGGVSSARNEGIKAARGEYIVFIDADDYINNTYLENFNKSNADLIICGYTPFGKTNIENKPLEFYSENKDEIIEHINTNFRQPYFGAPWCKAIRRSLFNDHELQFNANLRCGEDIELFFRLLSHIKSLKIFDSVGYYYYASPVSKYKLSAEEYKYHAETINKAIDMTSPSSLNYARKIVSDDLTGTLMFFLETETFESSLINSLKYTRGGGKNIHSIARPSNHCW